ncbi:class I SAM-dependent methyltransferase [soil metagenome]
MNSPCPLCHASATELYHTDGERRYFRCPDCALIHLDPAQRLAPGDERARYGMHRNAAGDPAYIQFLSRLADPLVRRLHPGARGLDFGCGPAPALASLLTNAGFPCAAYDPFFFPEEEPLSRQYDYVACSEVVEHSYDPAETFALFARLLVPGGVLGVMTRFYGHEKPFGEWWYRRDPTHVCFYDESTMQWVADRHSWSVAFPAPNVALFTRTEAGLIEPQPHRRT